MTVARRCLMPILILATAAMCDRLHAQAAFDCFAPSPPALVTPTVLGDGSAGSVTTAALQTALQNASAVRLNIGNSTLTLTQELVVSHDLILDANGATLSGGGNVRVLHVTNPNNLTYTFTLLNATVTGGATPTASGAGLWKPTGGPWQAVTIRIFNSHFVNNVAIAAAQDDGGGGLYVVGAKELSVVGGSFDNNRGSNGGAIYSLGSKQVNLFDMQMSGNSATGTNGNPGNGGNGGAMGVDGDDRNVNLCRVRVLGNSSNAFGAGFFTVSYATSSFTRIQDSTFANNTSVATDDLAGGAYIQGTSFSVRGSTFRGNQAAGYAGLALFDGTDTMGHVVHTTGDITNSTFVGNRAVNGLGGAMSISATGNVLIENVTIAANTSTCNGACFAGGIANDATSPITMRNTIFLNSTGDNAFNPWALLHPVSGSNNIQWPQVRSGSFGQQETAVTSGALFADALLGAPGSNGGPTETLALLSNSRGHSSAGRALAWHARGRRFDPAWLHHASPSRSEAIAPTAGRA
jgi:hypothetical protein